MSEEKIEVFGYRKDNITDYSHIRLHKSCQTREKIEQALQDAKERGLEWVVFDKETTSPDVWLLLLKCYSLQNDTENLQRDGIKQQFKDIISELDDLVEQLL